MSKTSGSSLSIQRRIAASLIDELTAKVIVEACAIRAPSVYEWKQRGIPKAQYKFLSVKFPKLATWKLAENLTEGVTPWPQRKA